MILPRIAFNLYDFEYWFVAQNRQILVLCLGYFYSVCTYDLNKKNSPTKLEEPFKPYDVQPWTSIAQDLDS